MSGADPFASDDGPPEPIPPAEFRAETKTTEEDYVLVPGFHKDDEGGQFEIGNDDFAEAVLDALPPGTLYRMEREVGRLEGPDGSKVFRPVTEVALRLLIDANVRLCAWVKYVNRKSLEEYQKLSYRPCTKDLAGLVLCAAATHPGTRALKILVSYPVYLPGLNLAQPGWNDAGVYYDEPPSLVGVKPKPEGALDVLDDLVADFPFEDEASRQNLYAAMLTMVARPAIDGPTPFFLVMASMERTGKGKLLDTAIGCAIRGTQIPPMQIGRDESEAEKRITTQILAGSPVVHLDNIPIGEVLDSASLASLATAYPLWSGRRLGGNTLVELPNRMVVLMSANNPKATGELVKRTVPIVLQPRSDHPELRDDFKHADCYGYAKERRPEVLSALLGIIELGRRSRQVPFRMGGFEAWSNVVTRSLREATATQVMGNYVAWCRRADDQNADIETLIEKWALLYSGSERSASQILELAEACGIFPGVFAKPTQQGKLMALSKQVLTPLTNRPVRGWIVSRSESGSNSTFHLRRAMP